MKMLTERVAGLSGMAWMILSTAFTSPLWSQAYFSEDFESGIPNPALEAIAPYFEVVDGALHRTSPQAFDDRRYLRTTLSDYNERDFIFEVTFTCKDDIIWFGLGPADRNSAYHEPKQSVVFWVRPTSIEGGVGFNTIFGSLVVDRVYSDGPHRVRIRKTGKRIGFELDEKYNGVFHADISTGLMDYSEVMPSLTSANSHLFFGSVAAANSFDDIVVSDPGLPTPDCNGNGVADPADITAGTSEDAGQDGIPDECQVALPYFSDEFEATVTNPSLEGYGSFFTVENGRLRRTGMDSFDDRHYLKTAYTDYNIRDFVFEVTFTTNDDIIFIGIGEAGLGAAYNEPKGSVNFRCHPRSLGDGYVGIATALGEVTIGTLFSAGPHRARIEKLGPKLTFSIDEAYNGTFEADMTHVFNNLPQILPAGNDRNSHLFFGNGSAGETFDDLSIRESIVSGPDCNQNRIPDADDILQGTSRDVNADGIPDECQASQGGVALVASAEPGVVKVMVTSDVPIRGGEIGLAFDPGALLPLAVRPGAELPAGAQIHADLSPQVSCGPGGGVAAGVTVGWVNSASGAVLTAAGTHELLEIAFEPGLSQLSDGCFPLRFVSCLGVPEAPIRNILSDTDGRTLLITATDGQVCVLGRPSFRRGDANGDGRFDISDPITILNCLFVGPGCPSCLDASDANDDGLVNIADPSYLLNWRFFTGAQPPSPFPACGADPTPDAIERCTSLPGCP